MNTPISPSEGRPQKRFRVGTKSCIECRRRKVRCDYPSNSQVCTGCSSHDIQCIPQKPKGNEESSHDVQARLAELEKLVRRLCTVVEVDAGPVSDILDTETYKTLQSTPFSMKRDSSVGKISDLSQEITSHDDFKTFENAPLFNLFKDVVDLKQCSNLPGLDTQHYDDPLVRNCLRSLGKYIPATKDLPWILERTGHFLNICPAIPIDLPTEIGSLGMESFVVNSLRSNDRVGVARGVLCITLIVQQLSRDSYIKVNLPSSQKLVIDEYLSAVETLLVSVETSTPNIDALVSLMVLSKVYTNIGRPRKSWLHLRRALNLGILLGLHRSSDSCQIALWSQIWQLERQLSLTIGFPYGIPNAQLGLPIGLSPEANLHHHMGIIAGRISDRNNNPGSDYSITELIDTELQRCKNEMPPGWWKLPTDTLNTEELYRLQILKIMYYDYVKILHLPYMFKQNPFNDSKVKALSASKDLIECYLVMRRGKKLIACDLMDFQAFSAAIVIMVNLLSGNNQEGMEDFAMLVEVFNTFKFIFESVECNVASQAANILDYLLQAYEGKYQDLNGYEATIPYFGKVKINFLTKPIELSPPTYDQEFPWNTVEFCANPFLTGNEMQMGEYPADQELGTDWTSFNWDDNYDWSQTFEIKGFE